MYSHSIRVSLSFSFSRISHFRFDSTLDALSDKCGCMTCDVHRMRLNVIVLFLCEKNTISRQHLLYMPYLHFQNHLNANTTMLI